MTNDNNESVSAWSFAALGEPNNDPKAARTNPSYQLERETSGFRVAARPTSEPKSSDPTSHSLKDEAKTKDQWQAGCDLSTSTPQIEPRRPNAQEKPRSGQPITLLEPAIEPRSMAIPGKTLDVERNVVAAEGVKSSRLLDEHRKVVERAGSMSKSAKNQAKPSASRPPSGKVDTKPPVVQKMRSAVNGVRNLVCSLNRGK
jgi:hypothetical protein